MLPEEAGHAAHGVRLPGQFTGEMCDELSNALSAAAGEQGLGAYLQHGDVSDAVGYLAHEAHAYMPAHRDAFLVRGAIPRSLANPCIR